MNKKNLFFLLLITFFQVSSQTKDKRLTGLETEIDSLMKAYRLVGLSVAIVENDEVIYSKGFGYRDLENKLPVTPNTLFSIGSVTKQFTSSLIGIYEGQGKLSLEDKPTFEKLVLHNLPHGEVPFVELRGAREKKDGRTPCNISGWDGNPLADPSNDHVCKKTDTFANIQVTKESPRILMSRSRDIYAPHAIVLRSQAVFAQGKLRQ